jgi:hypothetical protein
MFWRYGVVRVEGKASHLPCVGSNFSWLEKNAGMVGNCPKNVNDNIDAQYPCYSMPFAVDLRVGCSQMPDTRLSTLSRQATSITFMCQT